jgi:cell division protein FtsI/penicillin-binding protein 2
VRGHVIKESHPRPAARWSLTDIVTMSSNVGAAKVGLSLGPRRLRAGLKRMGFGQPTGVDFPGEQTGWFPAPQDLTDLAIATVSFGQGLTVTPLQLTRAMAGIASGGELPTPHFLLSEPQGTTRTWPKKRVLSKRSSTLMTKMLGEVVKRGTGQKAAVPGFRVAGKTGTAEVALSKNRGYAKGVYNSSFVGFLPAEDPAVVITVMLESPTKGYYGGSVAGPAFSAIGTYCMSHLDVSPPQAPKPRSKEATAASTPAVKKPAASGKKPTAKPAPGPARSKAPTSGNDAVTTGEPEAEKP